MGSGSHRATFPAPAHVKPSGPHFTALGFPVGFVQGLCDRSSRERFRQVAPCLCPPLPACVPSLLGQPSLEIKSPSQVLRPLRRLYHPVLCLRVVGDPRAAGRLQLHGTITPPGNTTTRPSATLSPSAHFPVLPVIEPTLLRRFRTGARRASPVAQSVLCHRATASTPPKWVGRLSQLSTAHTAFAHWWQARPFGIDCRGHLRVHLRCGPMTRKSPQGRPCR